MSGNVSVTVGSGGSVKADLGQKTPIASPDVTRLDDTTAAMFLMTLLTYRIILVRLHGSN